MYASRALVNNAAFKSSLKQQQCLCALRSVRVHVHAACDKVPCRDFINEFSFTVHNMKLNLLSLTLLSTQGAPEKDETGVIQGFRCYSVVPQKTKCVPCV